ncbi:MAG: VCBS repeat-containing protein [Cyclobacteriaceae bacterium]
MLRKILWLLLISFIWSCSENKIERNVPVPVEDPLFDLLSPEQTGVNFQNNLVEGLNTNILMYEYFYNGGGVTTADFNGDDRLDIYFTSNMEENALYLNKSNFQFENVTAIAGVTGRPGPWKTGVTYVDINADERLDLYISYSGALPADKRTNQLFVNQGNDENGVPLFEEQAAQYGLASTAHSNQAYFFDYDKDGDLDMLLLNHNPKSLPVLNEVSSKAMLAKDDKSRGLRLFKRTGDQYVDATQSSGIVGSALSYGLSLGIADFNNDHWPDFYVANDYAVPDYLYINNGDGTFTNEVNERLGHTSQFSMGSDMADINNDGLIDIFTLDMLPADNKRQKLLLAPDNYAKFDLNVRSGFHHQYMRNMLQLNNGDGTFSEIGQFAGVSNTDWSWSALLADYDNDGLKDLYVTNGYYRDYTNLDFIKYMDDYVQGKSKLEREDVLEIISNMPASNVSNYMFKNSEASFTNTTQEWGLSQPASSSGAVYADLDNDGDLDLVVNNIGKPAFIYRNNTERKGNHYLKIKLKGDGQNTMGMGAQIALQVGDRNMTIEQYNSRGYLSGVSPVVNFGLGNDSLVNRISVRWPSGLIQVVENITADQQLTLWEKDARTSNQVYDQVNPIFREVTTSLSPLAFSSNRTQRDFDRQPLLISEFSKTQTCFESSDFNQDGLTDFFVGGKAGESAYLLMGNDSGDFEKLEVASFRTDIASHDVAATIFDANADGLDDIYVASGGYHDYTSEDPLLQDRFYMNDGQGGYYKNTRALPEMHTSTAVVRVNDFNDDGFEDLFVAGRVIPGRYPESPRSYLLINDGRGRFSDETSELAEGIDRLGMVSDAQWVDLNKDDIDELVVVGNWMPISIFEKIGNKLVNHTASYFSEPLIGMWNVLDVSDLNGDLLPDLIVGNMGMNTQLTATIDQPLELVFDDFDDNGSIDPILNSYIENESYPYITRDELLGQLSRMRSKFPSYAQYSNAELSDIFSNSEIQNAAKLHINTLKTCVFINQGGKSFSQVTLPDEVQYAAVKAIWVDDFNGDDIKDVLLAGNDHYLKLRLGKVDANYGMMLRGDKKGTYHYVPQTLSGFHVRGEVQDIISVDGNIIFNRVDAPVAVYRLNE